MPKKIQRPAIITAVLLAVFLLFTILAKTVDVQPIGPMNTEVGFAAGRAGLRTVCCGFRCCCAGFFGGVRCGAGAASTVSAAIAAARTIRIFFILVFLF